ncbi:uncharacterized protein LOC125490647 isoform X1 [Plutella xylostella]|uniref:uncharacterized protein LOC125490647 isoform X1 n=1 Tax=Plutella xylostella TaxID=51655 RepID=UPI002032D423|nr:uncharacterized protein LOC125490647 isoform X1 [Plutella xylostella]
MKSSPTNALQVECVDPPLSLRRQYLCDRFFFRIWQSNSHPLLPKLDILKRLCNAQETHGLSYLLKTYIFSSNLPHPTSKFSIYPLFDVPYDALVFQPNVVMDLGISKDSPAAEKALSAKLNSEWSGWLPIFTDASKLSENSNVGLAVWLPKYKVALSFKRPPESSVFTGEATAILEALLYAESHKLNKTIILSDSASSLQAIISFPFKSKSKFPIILKIRETLFRCMTQGIEVAIAWIPGHSGIIGPRLDRSWKVSWDTSRNFKGKFYSHIQPHIPKKPWFFKAKHLDKPATSTLCRLRLGHACTPVHLARIRVRDSSVCDCGASEGSVDHLFFECPNLQTSLYDILPPTIPKPVNTNYLLTLVHTPLVNILYKFLKTNNIKL